MYKNLKVAMIVAALLFSFATISSASAATYNVTDSSYGSYFGANGHINHTTVSSGDVLDYSGAINNKYGYIDLPVTITSSNKTGKINNGTITIVADGSGTNVTNLYFKNINHNGEVAPGP